VTSAKEAVQTTAGFCIETLQKLWPMVLGDFTAMWLIAGNIISVAWVLITGDSWSSILILYCVELFILGFYAMIRFPFIHRLGGTLIMPVFAAIYFSMLQWMLVLAGIVLQAENGGPLFKEELARENYSLAMAVAAVPLFVSHGISFFVNFVGKRQWERMTIEQNLMRSLVRIMPILLISIPVAIFVLLTGSAFFSILFIVPLKVAWDLVMHFRVNELWDPEQSTDPVQNS